MHASRRMRAVATENHARRLRDFGRYPFERKDTMHTLTRDLSSVSSVSLINRRIANACAQAIIGVFFASWLGMCACWVRIGELSVSVQHGYLHFQSPTYFWFTTGCIAAMASVAGLLALPVLIPAGQKVTALRFHMLVFINGALSAIGYEILKPTDMIEPATPVIIVFLTSCVAAITIHFAVSHRNAAKPQSESQG
jgi:hypothetical protein